VVLLVSSSAFEGLPEGVRELGIAFVPHVQDDEVRSTHSLQLTISEEIDQAVSSPIGFCLCVVVSPAAASGVARWYGPKSGRKSSSTQESSFPFLASRCDPSCSCA
jgi:hypothetical protein